MKWIAYLCIALITPIGIAFGQTPQRDRASYQAFPTSYYWGTIVNSLKRSQQTPPQPRKSFKIDLSDRTLPNDPQDYTQIWHTDPISQGQTGTCWCYSTTSFYESEVQRITGKEVKLSEMYTVYWEYVERARYFVQSRGTMHFGEGSETNAVARMIEKYGIVPQKDYPGIKPGFQFHTHDAMFAELDAYLKGVKQRNAWNQKEVVATTRAILDHHMGTIPTSVQVGKKTMTPTEYRDHLGLKMDEYVNFMSLMAHPYWANAEYDVPDNWWNSKDYYNVPLDNFLQSMKSALQQGYTFSIGGDISEAGLVSYQGVAVVPTFDIPAEYIDESARQFRFNNGSTTDDHAMHVVGYREFEGDTWFLVKDSGSGSRHCGEGCKSFGYYFFHEDFVKLKMMTFTVHSGGVKQLMQQL